MSEAERKRRQDYKRNRKKWIFIQTIIIALVAIISFSSYLVYNRLDRTYYIEYTEGSSSNYQVHYKENSFFEDEWIEEGQSYVTELVDEIKATFDYQMNMDTSNVAFDYTYEVLAQLVISDKTTGAHIYDPTDTLLSQVKKSVSGSDNFRIVESVSVDFSRYNATFSSYSLPFNT